MKRKFIYSLSHWDFTAPLSREEGPEDVVFYVGKTSDPEKRLISHRSKAKTGHEDVYALIRDLEAKKIPWEMTKESRVRQLDYCHRSSACASTINHRCSSRFPIVLDGFNS